MKELEKIKALMFAVDEIIDYYYVWGTERSV